MLFDTVFKKCPLLPAETLAFMLAGTNDLNKPFTDYGGDFWDEALQEDVFKLAVLHNSFAKIGTEAMFKKVIDRELIGNLSIAKELLNPELAQTLADYSAEQGQTEITAWLLNYLNPAENLPQSPSIEDMINERFDL